jgi:amidase
MPNPFAALDATAQAELLRTGDVGPVELVDAALAAIDATAELDAVIHRRDDRARAEAEQAEVGAQPFAGVPLVVKDLDGFLAGEPYHAGSAHLRDRHFVPDWTSELIARLQRVGFVVVGKANTPELGLIPSTEPVAYGPTHNPWDPTRTPGGSSGGSAAAVAAGVVPVGHAGDGGGSIRIPAAFCGLFGLKPSRGRISLGPTESEAWGGLVSRLVVTRSVRDTAAILDAVEGPLPGDPYWALRPTRPYLEAVTTPARRLRIGWTTATGDGSGVDAGVAAAVQRAAEAAEEMGHEVVEATDFPSSDSALVEEMTAHFLSVWPVWVAQALAQFERWTGEAPTAETVEPHTWALADLGRTVDAVTYADGLDGLRALSRRIVAWWDDHDLLLTPTVGELPPVLGQFGPADDNPMAGVFRSTPIVTFTIPFNITGQPAASVPVGESQGLPAGVQIVGGPARDDLVLGLAAQLEEALPWADRRPQVWAG